MDLVSRFHGFMGIHSETFETWNSETRVTDYAYPSTWSVATQVPATAVMVWRNWEFLYTTFCQQKVVPKLHGDKFSGLWRKIP